MKSLVTLALVAFAAPFAFAQSSTDPMPKNVDVHKAKGPEKAVMNVSPSGKAVVITPGQDAQGRPPSGLQTKMTFPDPERPLKKETTTIRREKVPKSSDSKTVK